MAAARSIALSAAALGLLGSAAGCASQSIDAARAFASVTPLPAAVALEGQRPDDQEWDAKDCQAEAGHRTSYSPTDSPMANLFQKLFFWGTVGASFGGLSGGFPATIQSDASTGLIAGASAGAGVGAAAASLSGFEPYQRAWIACMQSHGYAIVPPGAVPPPPPPRAGGDE